MPNSKAKTSKAKKPAVKKQPAPRHDTVKLTYAGASPTIRGHGFRLTPVRLDYSANSITPRDQSFCHDMRAAYGDKAKAGFKRLDGDAGAIGRGITLGNVKHVSGDLASRNCVFALTERGYSLGKSN